MSRLNYLQRNSALRRHSSPFGTKIEYACGLGRELEVAGSAATTPSVTIECDWNATWTPSAILPSCVCECTNFTFIISLICCHMNMNKVVYSNNLN